MSSAKQGTCMVCFKSDLVKNYEFYIIGSEGCDLCEQCQIHVSMLIREVRAMTLSLNHRLRSEYFKKLNFKVP